MRGEVWAFAPAADRPATVLAVVQHRALNEVSPTVVGVLVTDRPQRAGPPLVVPLEPADTGLPRPLWAKVNHLRTVAVADARQRVAVLNPACAARVDEALSVVLGLDGAGFPAGPGSAPEDAAQGAGRA